METESLAANAIISAQETVSGQAFSNAVFASSMTSKPGSDKFGTASFSAVMFAVELISTEASQPYAGRTSWILVSRTALYTCMQGIV